MKKVILTAATLCALAFGASNALAQSPAVAMDCGTAITVFGNMMAHMPSDANRTKAMKELAMAKSAMAGHHMKQCMVHIGQVEQVFSGK